ncbi:hypothetical protein ANCDUO_08845 [Ancylostoma duodenale]|uniref:Unspecific monooxygenase n=1 Tax=Ancylostoma duodenale TaxID=51022 RepID=A0A0C2DES2_9BILA|nr:hypothetical protein ANCDUO_08845 [Ancylostoma duodenale]
MKRPVIGDDFSARSGLFPDTIFQNVENGGVLLSQGDNWKAQPHASLHILRDFGMGKNLMEEQLRICDQYSRQEICKIVLILPGQATLPSIICKRLREDIDQALKSYNIDQEPQCFVHAYYQQMQTNPQLNFENLINVCMDFFFAGMESTSTTLRWGTLLLAKNEDVQASY